MSRTSTLIVLGILVILTPFSGLPIAIRTLLAVIFGACISSIGLTFRTREMQDLSSPIQVSTPEQTPPEIEAPAPRGVSPI